MFPPSRVNRPPGKTVKQFYPEAGVGRPIFTVIIDHDLTRLPGMPKLYLKQEFPP